MIRLFHGSYGDFEPDFRLTGGREGYEEEWSFGLNYYAALHARRPEGMLSHCQAVFACDNIGDIDKAGGATSGWVLLVEADEGVTTRHDQRWAMAMSDLISHGAADDDPEVIRLADLYWSHEPSEDPVWEYLAPAMVVIDSAHNQDGHALAEMSGQARVSAEMEPA